MRKNNNKLAMVAIRAAVVLAGISCITVSTLFIHSVGGILTVILLVASIVVITDETINQSYEEQ